MEGFKIYQDIAKRTDGDIYVGVVGPVRTGKSTFIKKFMEQFVLPNIDNEYKKERAKDELPQSAGGRTIMTTEPKFVPNEAVEITIDKNLKLKNIALKFKSFTIFLIIKSCWASFLPKYALLHFDKLKSLDTTVQTPSKCPGRDFPHNLFTYL